MKTTIGALKGAIKKACKATGASNCAIKVENNQLSVIASSLNGNIKIDVPSEGGCLDCSASVTWKQVNAILGGGMGDDAPCDILPLKGDAAGIRLKFGGANIKLQTPYDPYEAVEMLHKPEETDCGQVVDVFQLEGKQFQELLSGPLQNAAKSDVRYYLVGIRMEAEGAGLRAIGTNGWALCSALGREVDVNPAMKEFILPLATAEAIGEVFQGDEVIRVQQMGKDDNIRLLFSSASTRWMSNTISGKYPDWQRVLPKYWAAKTQCKLPRSGIVASINRILAASGQSFVVFNFSTNGVELKSPDGEQKEFFETPVDLQGREAAVLGATGELFAKAIASVNTENFILNLDWSDEKAPEKFILHPEDGEEDWIGVVMPARV